MKTLFIFNPVAGKGNLPKHLTSIVNILSQNGNDTSVIPTQKKGDATRITMEKAPEFDLVICGGGDGTLNEVITGLMQHKSRPQLGYIPTGTTNDFAGSLHIPKDPMAALHIVQTGKPFGTDIGAFNGGYFVYVAAFGLFTKITYTTSQKSKKILGHFAYVLSGIGDFFKAKSYRVKIEYENKVIEDDFYLAAFSNTTSIGGMLKFREDDVGLDDGVFEVLLIKAPRNKLILLRVLLGVTLKKYNSKYVSFFSTSDLRITGPSPIPWCLDGEDGGLHTDVRIRNLPNSIYIMTPSGKKQREKNQKFSL